MFYQREGVLGRTRNKMVDQAAKSLRSQILLAFFEPEEHPLPSPVAFTVIVERFKGRASERDIRAALQHLLDTGDLLLDLDLKVKPAQSARTGMFPTEVAAVCAKLDAAMDLLQSAFKQLAYTNNTSRLELRTNPDAKNSAERLRAFILGVAEITDTLNGHHR